MTSTQSPPCWHGEDEQKLWICDDHDKRAHGVTVPQLPLLLQPLPGAPLSVPISTTSCSSA